MNPENRPDGILITMSWQNVAEWRGEKVLNRYFQRVFGKETDQTFWYRLGRNMPKMEVLEVYIVFHNMVQWKFRFVGYEKTGSEGVTLYRLNEPLHLTGTFVIMTGPAVKAPPGIRYKGFQGFRYTETIF